MTPPLLRSLPLAPREEEHWFDQCWITLKDGTGLYIQRGTPKHTEHAGEWFLYHTRVAGQHDILEHGKSAGPRDEFETQCLLDYYAQEFGIERIWVQAPHPRMRTA